MRSMAKMFCGEEIGLVMPPMLEARATPITCVCVLVYVCVRVYVCERVTCALFENTTSNEHS